MTQPVVGTQPRLAAFLLMGGRYKMSPQLRKRERSRQNPRARKSLWWPHCMVSFRWIQPSTQRAHTATEQHVGLPGQSRDICWASASRQTRRRECGGALPPSPGPAPCPPQDAPRDVPGGASGPWRAACAQHRRGRQPRGAARARPGARWAAALLHDGKETNRRGQT